MWTVFTVSIQCMSILLCSVFCFFGFEACGILTLDQGSNPHFLQWKAKFFKKKNNKYLFLIVLEAEESKIKVLADLVPGESLILWCLVRPFFLACKQLKKATS